MAQERRIGSYTLHSVLGSGAMGQVWSATDADGATCAVKLLRTDLADDTSVVNRFLAERTVLLSLHDPHIVQVHDLVAERGQLGIVMDLVEGGSLRGVLRQHGTLSPAEVARLGSEIGQGLQTLHSAGVIHRDIKPENVLMDVGSGRPEPRLADFGIAKVLDTSGVTARSTALVGTPSYLAPELGDGDPPSPASDLYALGIMLYECVCGVAPFGAPSPLALLRMHADRLPGRPDGVPDPLWNVIAHLLAKSPARRPQSAGWVANVLTQIAPQLHGVSALTPLDTPPPSESIIRDMPTEFAMDDQPTQGFPAEGTASSSGHSLAGTETKKRTGRGALAAGLVALLVVAGGGTAYALTHKGDPAPRMGVETVPPASTHHNQSATEPSTPSSTSTTSTDSTPSSTTTTPTAPETMPKVTGMTLADAENALPGVTVKVKDQVSEKADDGTVIGQTPKAGASVGDTVTLQVARQPVTQYLDELAVTSGDDYDFPSGPATSDKKTYPHALSNEFCGYGANQTSLEWNLGGHYQKLKATVGQDDNSPSTETTGLVQVFADGREVFSKMIKFGTAVPMNVDVTDVLRLKVEVDGSTCGEDDEATMVLGSPRLLGVPGQVPTPTDDGEDE